MAQATALTGAMMSDVEILATIAEVLPTSSTLRRAFTECSTADQKTIARQASGDINACLWRGSRADDDDTDGDGDGGVSDQVHAFPRTGPPEIIEIEADVPSGASFTSWSVAGIPFQIRWALAIQAGYRAAVNAGWMELNQHSHPWNRLHTEAQQMASVFRRGSCNGV